MLPVRIELINFQSYSKANLDFNFSSTLIIGEIDDNQEASNGSGKSTLLAAIAWALYGKTKQANADAVVKRGQDFCQVDFVFEHEDKRYRILRKRNVKFSRAEVELFEVAENGTERQIPGDTNTEINDHIKNIVKSNYDVFINSSYFMQQSISGFMTGTTSDRQKLVSSILNLDRWNEYLKQADQRAKEFQKKVGQLEFRLKGMADIESELSAARAELIKHRTDSESANVNDERLVEEIGELERRLMSLKGQEASLNSYHDNVSRLDNVRSRIRDLKSSFAEKQGEETNLSTKIQEADRLITQIGEKVVEISANLDLQTRIDIPAIERELSEVRTKDAWLQKQMAAWRPDDLCRCCNLAWSTHADKVEVYQANLSEHRAAGLQITKLKEKLQAARAASDRIRQTELDIEKYTSRRKSIENSRELLVMKQGIAGKEVQSATQSLETETVKETELLLTIEGLKKIAESSSFEHTREMLQAKKTAREANLKVKNELLYRVGGLSQKVEELEKDNAEKAQLALELTQDRKEVASYETLVRAFGRNGIQAVIVDNVVEELTRVSNDWLNQLAYEPTYLKFITQKKDSKGGWKEALDIEITTQSGASEFEGLSTGEGFRVAFAIRLALAQIQARRMGGESQLLLLDEVSSSLDKQGLETFMSIIRKLEKQIKIMVITHDDNLKDQFDHIIKVKKTNQDSVLIVL